MWEVTLTFWRSNMSNSRGSPSLNPYSYHLAAGRSGYFGSIGGIGDSAPLDGWSPASICIEMEITIRAPSGQNGASELCSSDDTEEVCIANPFDCGVRDTTPAASAETAPSLIKSR